MINYSGWEIQFYQGTPEWDVHPYIEMSFDCDNPDTKTMWVEEIELPIGTLENEAYKKAKEFIDLDLLTME